MPYILYSDILQANELYPTNYCHMIFFLYELLCGTCANWATNSAVTHIKDGLCAAGGGSGIYIQGRYIFYMQSCKLHSCTTYLCYVPRPDNGIFVSSRSENTGRYLTGLDQAVHQEIKITPTMFGSWGRRVGVRGISSCVPRVTDLLPKGVPQSGLPRFGEITLDWKISLILHWDIWRNLGKSWIRIKKSICGIHDFGG